MKKIRQKAEKKADFQSGLNVLFPYMAPYRNLLIIGTFYAFIGASASALAQPGWAGD